MEEQPPNYHGAFFKSPHHAAWALLTVGLGFIAAQPLLLLVGVTAYGLGWIYLPDTAFFRGWVDRRREAAHRTATLAQVEEFVRRRNALLASLTQSGRDRYENLVAVCHDIEAASADSLLATPDPRTDPRLRKLDELMWTYLRLLSIQDSLERFLETERRENLPGLVTEAEQEIGRLNSEMEALKPNANGPLLETKKRYISSRLERLEVLRKRQQRVEQAHANVALVISEQERLAQQIKLIRADAVASKNADALTARIDATVEHLDQTNKWLSEMDEFKDLVGDMPQTEARVGYQSAAPPLIEPADENNRRRPAARTLQR